MILSGGTTTLGVYDFKASLDKEASSVNSANGETQQQINDYIGTTWYSKVGGYGVNDKARLDTGKVVVSTIPANTNNPNTNMTGWKVLGKPRIVSSVAELRTLEVKSEDVVITLGHTQVGIGSGVYKFEAPSNKVDNNGAWIASTVANGTWVLVSPLKFENFGIIEGPDDQGPKIQACLDFARDQKIYDISFEPSHRYTINSTVIIKPYTIAERDVYYSTAPKLSIKTNGSLFTTYTNNIIIFKVFREMTEFDVLNIVTNAANVTGVQVGISSLGDLYDTSKYVNSCAFFMIGQLFATGLYNGVVFSPFGLINGYAYGAFYHSIGSVVFKDVKHGLVFSLSKDGNSQTTRSEVGTYKHNGGACAIVGLNLESFTITSFNVENLKEISIEYPEASQRAVYIPKRGENSAFVNHSIAIDGACEEVPFPVFCKAERSEVNVFAGVYDVSQPIKAFQGNYTSAIGGTGQIPYVTPNTFYFAQSRCRFGVINTSSASSPEYPPIFSGELYGSLKFEPASSSNNETGSQILTVEYPNPSIWRRIVRNTNTNTPTFFDWVRIDADYVQTISNVDCNTLRTSDLSKKTWSIANTNAGLHAPVDGEYYGVITYTPINGNEGMQEAVNVFGGNRKYRKHTFNSWSGWV